MKGARNEPCSCGSGNKYKVCCAVKRTRSQWAAVVSVAVFVVVAALVVAGALRDASDADWSAAPPGKIWSEEHGHWHDVAPPGPVPPGKVWSAEHGHWHDAETGAAAGETWDAGTAGSVPPASDP